MTNKTTHYKWTILKHIDGVYALTGYVYVEGSWSQDGKTLHFDHIVDVVKHITKQEAGLND